MIAEQRTCQEDWGYPAATVRKMRSDSVQYGVMRRHVRLFVITAGHYLQHARPALLERVTSPGGWL
jgi:hypothetical protein